MIDGDLLLVTGYECEEHNNPPDFFLDVINGDSTAVQAIQSGNLRQHFQQY